MASKSNGPFRQDFNPQTVHTVKSGGIGFL